MKRILSALLTLLLLLPAACGAEGVLSRDKTVGDDIAPDAVTDFYYTVDASTFPPRFQRYRFCAEDGARVFFHETREGDHWPLTEKDVALTGHLRLTEDEWAAFCDVIRGGAAKRREDSLDDGDEGPWLFIYWTGGEPEGRAFAFATWEKRAAFEDLCAALTAKSTEEIPHE